MKKYVLIACEESQVECTEFRKLGVDAYSCDIQRPSGKHPEWHIQGDVTPFLKGRRVFYTNDGKLHRVLKWDLIIAHPPCTYLSKAGATSMFKGKQLNEHRYAYLVVARDFFMQCLSADAKYICVENPTPLKIAELPPHSQVVQPYEYGHPYTKRTCLWLKNLPTLMPEVFSTSRKSWVYLGGSQKHRSRSFKGIAAAMAKQWTPII